MLLAVGLHLVDITMINCSARGALQSKTWKNSLLNLKVTSLCQYSYSQLKYKYIPTDIPLDLRHRPGDPKWATVTVQFGILKPGSTFAQTRSSPTALGFTPPDTGQLKKIKDIGDKRPASGKHFENQVCWLILSNDGLFI